MQCNKPALSKLFDAAIGSMTRSQKASCLDLYTLLPILDLFLLNL